MILNHTGFCYSDMRYLSKREAVDRLLFADQKSNFDGKTITGINVESLTIDKKKNKAQEKNLGEYPNNCRTMKTSSNGMFLLYHIDCVGHKKHTDYKHPLYFYNMYYVDGCGKRLEYQGDTLHRKENYLYEVEKNKKYWERR